VALIGVGVHDEYQWVRVNAQTPIQTKQSFSRASASWTRSY
jgi:hypothetical protein